MLVTDNVSTSYCFFVRFSTKHFPQIHIYSNGRIEIILGNAIKKLNLAYAPSRTVFKSYHASQVYFPIAKEGSRLDGNLEDSGSINQHRLNRRVRPSAKTQILNQVLMVSEQPVTDK